MGKISKIKEIHACVVCIICVQYIINAIYVFIKFGMVINMLASYL